MSVTLENVRASRSEVVIGISHQFGTISLRMQWVTPTHLDVNYGPSPGNSDDDLKLDYYVAKTDGIDISISRR
jgi:hypothetical protein